MRQPTSPRPEKPTPAAEGTQAIRRAAAVLKAIARANPRSVSMADITRSEGLPRSTAHRILQCLLDEGFIEHPEGSLRYQMGALAYELGLAVSSASLEVARWRSVVDAVARRTGVTTYLMRRNGMEAVCMARAEGSAVVRVIPVEVGQRRFLGVGAGATALLAALDPDTCEHLIHMIAPELRDYPAITETNLREAVQQARQTGVAISHSKVMPQSFGMGVVIPDQQAAPWLAISIAAHQPSVTDADVGQWAQIIKEEIQNAVLARKLASPSP